jgi:hypothetical protein
MWNFNNVASRATRLATTFIEAAADYGNEEVGAASSCNPLPTTFDVVWLPQTI